MEFWEQKKAFFPELCILAQVVLPVPATQISIELFLSGLNILLLSTKSNITKILNKQLFVRTTRIFERNIDVTCIFINFKILWFLVLQYKMI